MFYQEHGWAVCDHALPMDLIKRVRVEAGLFTDFYEQASVLITYHCHHHFYYPKVLNLSTMAYRVRSGWVRSRTLVHSYRCRLLGGMLLYVCTYRCVYIGLLTYMGVLVCMKLYPCLFVFILYTYAAMLLLLLLLLMPVCCCCRCCRFVVAVAAVPQLELSATAALETKCCGCVEDIMLWKESHEVSGL